jgi:exonuclease III
MTSQGRSGSVVVPEPSQTHDTFLRWGDNLNKKQDSTIRIGFNNINGFKSEINHVHNHDIKAFILKYEFDIFGMCEVNLHWKNCHHHWSECTKGWFQRLHSNVAYYKTFPTTAAFQVGGVMQFIIGHTTTRVASAGRDELGRWAWHTLRGKNNRTIRIISAYRPVKNEVIAGSVWNQQQYHADLINSKLNPHECWIKELSKEIRKWSTDGDSIILMVDLNEDVVTSSVARALRMLGLREIVTTKHGISTNTHLRGSNPIDGIYVSGEIGVSACGYVESPSDHLAVWLDIEADSMFSDLQNNSKQSIRRLQCSDPRAVKKYNESLGVLKIILGFQFD